MADKVNNLQDMFLNGLRRTKTPVTMFLVKGVKLQGIITWFDNFSVLLRRDGQAQLIYKHAISTIMPSHPLDIGEIERAFDEGGAGAKNAPGRDRRLRPVLPAAGARWPLPARLQARHLDRAARAAGQFHGTG